MTPTRRARLAAPCNAVGAAITSPSAEDSDICQIAPLVAAIWQPRPSVAPNVTPRPIVTRTVSPRPAQPDPSPKRLSPPHPSTPSLLHLLILILLLTACANQSQDPPPPVPNTPTTQSTTNTPPSTRINPSPTLALTAAAAETATLPPPSVATATSAPAIAPQPPTTEPGEANILLTAPEDFAPNRNRLTGEELSDPTVLQRRPIACKLSNFPAQYTRPQSGLNDADLLFEHMTEGGLTRFTALFHDTAPPRIGPIRSARLVDLELPAMYDAALCFSGASTGVSQLLFQSDFRDRIFSSNAAGYYRTGENKPYEHTLYADPQGLWQALDSMGQNQPPQFGNLVPFSSQPPPGGQPANAVTVDYRSEVANWRYDPGSGRYWRWTDGAPHLDANTNEQVNFKNVVVVKAVQVDDATICEEIRNGVCSHLSVEIQLWGQGEAIVFRDGQSYNAAWRRQNRNDMLTFYDSAGNPIPLAIGNTFFQLVPANLTGYPITIE